MRYVCLAVALAVLAGCTTSRDLDDMVFGERVDAVVVRVNCGAGQDYVDSMGNLWLADRERSAGGPWGAAGGTVLESHGLKVAGTAAPDVYLSLRQGMSAYEFDLPKGTYSVVLHFAELDPAAAYVGGRLFSVSLNGKPASDIEPFRLGRQGALTADAAAGGLRPGMLAVPKVKVRGAGLRVEFAAQVGAPVVSGIEVVGRKLSRQLARELPVTMQAPLDRATAEPAVQE